MHFEKRNERALSKILVNFDRIPHMDQGILEGSHGYLGILVSADPIPNDLPVPAVHDNNGMAPAGIPAEEVRHISGPALVERIAY